MKPFARRLAGFAASAMLVVATVGFTAAQAGAEENRAASDVGAQTSCSHAWSVVDGRTGSTTGNGVNIRTGPHNTSPACTIVGQAQASHSLRYDCWDSGTGGTWSHVYDYATGVSGWIKDSLLVGNGAYYHC
ncbi:SH3 domain-containing protein [Glycomyces sp. NPDC047369]